MAESELASSQQLIAPDISDTKHALPERLDSIQLAQAKKQTIHLMYNLHTVQTLPPNHVLSSKQVGS